MATLDTDWLNRRLNELNEPLSLWYAQVKAESKEIFEAEPITAENFLERAREARRIAEAHAGEGPWNDVHLLLDELCAEYVRLNSEQSYQVREVVRKYPAIMLALIDDYEGRVISLLKSSGDKRWVAICLAAVSIENNARDFRDSYSTLSELYLTAVRLGIDPKPSFHAIAKLSATDVNGSTSSVSMRNFLDGFHTSSYFREDVRPHLHEYRQQQAKEGRPWWEFWRKE